MGLYRMDTLLKQAGRQHIALGAFECWESMNIQGIAKAAAITSTATSRTAMILCLSFIFFSFRKRLQFLFIYYSR